jgi:energy-coupling factor transport system permease protein
MRSAFAYVPRPGPLQAASPGAAVAYLGSLLVVAFIFSSPLVLAAIGGALALAGALAGAGRAVRVALRMGLGLALLVVAVNAIVVDRGATVVARLGEWPLFGRVDVTLEALVAGFVIGLLVLVTVLAGAIYSACVDPDRVLRALRPVAGRSALTATLASRMFPVAVADGARLAEAARLRGPGAAPVGRAPLARRLLAGSLDRAVDVAATLELRGYGLGGPRARQIRRRSRHDRRFYVTAAGVLAAGIAGRLLGAGGFDAYPTVSIDPGPATLALSALLLLAGLAPLRRAPRRRAVSAPPLADLRGPAAAPPLEAGGV